MNWKRSAFLLVMTWVCLATTQVCAQRFVRRIKVKVTAPTQMDWMYPVFRTSPKEVPGGTLTGYDSTDQRYDYYGPVAASPGPHSLIVFIPFTNSPMGWDLVGPTCVAEGMIYVEPHRAGNRVPLSERVRITLDCMDEVRRRYDIDPDHTYIAGYSGGGSTAALIAMAIPEYFGGLLVANARVATPTLPWRIDRVRGRLSIACVCGEREAIGFELPKVQMPIFKAMGIRMHAHAIPQRGHGAPPPNFFHEALLWLEEDARNRSRFAETRTAIRAEGWPTRTEWAAAAVEESRQLLEDEETIHVGLGLLTEISKRWIDTKEAAEARKILDDYAAKENRPWEETAKTERLALTRVLAETYDQASQSKVRVTKIRRAAYARGALDNYQVLIRESGDDELVEQANSRILLMQKLVDNAQAAMRKSP